MAHRTLTFIKAPLYNGVGRYVCQLQRLTLTFCKTHGSSRFMREYIERDLVNFARDNPGVVVYLKPRRHRDPLHRGRVPERPAGHDARQLHPGERAGQMGGPLPHPLRGAHRPHQQIPPHRAPQHTRFLDTLHEQANGAKSLQVPERGTQRVQVCFSDGN
ncbi:hypothetical protein MRX96_051289 [Rhipicephalus microplus]